MNEPPTTVTCETCGRPMIYTGTKRCDLCWNVERNLAAYLKSPGGQQFARKAMPLLDDWADGEPDAFDYEAILRENEVTVEWGHQNTSDGVTFSKLPPALCGWGFYWKHGAIHIGQTAEIIARKAAALFVSLWLRGVSASLCDKLMDGFIVHLERQEGKSLTCLAEIERRDTGHFDWMLLTREGMFTRRPLDEHAQRRIIGALDPQPDEEIIVTFSTRKKP